MSQVFPCQIKTVVETRDPAKYISRLCRHFSHKLETEWTDAQGRIEFSIGRCLLHAEPHGLAVLCEAPDNDQLLELMDVVKAHFDRFAAKENLVLRWSSQQQQQQQQQQANFHSAGR